MRETLGVVRVEVEEGVVRYVARIALTVAVALTCAVVLGAAGSPARASTVPGPKAAQTIESIHELQIALQSYCVDYGDRWPRFTTNRRFRALLTPYVDRWPTNPWSHRSMRQKRNRGNFTYSRVGDSYRLVGWGPHDRRIIVVP
jgi:hypothetical protein